MRAENAIRNSIYSVVCYIASGLLILISRKIFLNLMGQELLGYDGLFKNILSLLTVFDMGAGSAITYQLYKVIAEKDLSMIHQLMNLYRRVYRIIVLVILMAGCLAIPFLPYLASNSSIGFLQLSKIYSLQMLGMLSTYFMAYKRVRFVAEQQEYICIKIELFANVTAQIVKLLVIYKYQSYWMYLWVTILQNLICNIIISKNYKNIYGIEKKCKLTKEEYAKWHILSDMKNFIVHKVGYLVYGATDNIVISTFMGVSHVALYTNYILVINYLNVLLNKLITPLTASIANLVYSNDDERGIDLFFALDFICYVLGLFMMGGIITCTQPFINLWIGSEYLLPMGFLVLMAINVYIGWIQTALAIFRASYGEFQEDKKYYLLSAGVNLIMSIMLVKPFGFSGIMIGTVVGHLLIGFGRMQFVFKQFVKISPTSFLWEKIRRTGLAIGECLIVYIIVKNFPVSIGGIVLRCVVVTGALGITNFLMFYRQKPFQTALSYVRSSIIKILARSKN